MKKLIILLVALVSLTTAYCQTADEYFDMGVSKLQLEDYRGAIADYTKVIEIDPNDATAYHERGFAKLQLKDNRGAIADYTKAIEIDPNDAIAYNGRGLAKLVLGQLDDGCLDLSKAGELGLGQAYEVIKEKCN